MLFGLDTESMPISMPEETTRSMDQAAPKPSALDTSGWKKLEAGDTDAAIADFSEALNNNAADTVALNGRANAAVKKFDYNQALADANYALFKNPSDHEARWTRARIYLDINRYREAVNELRALLVINPDFAPAHILMGQAMVLLGNKSDAASEFHRAAGLVSGKQPELAKELNQAAGIYQPNTRDMAIASDDTGGSADKTDKTTDKDKAADLDQLSGERTFVTENLAKVSQVTEVKDGRAFFNGSVKWPNGHTITVAFLGGDSNIRKFIADLAPTWGKYANLKFDFIDPKTGTFREWSAKDKSYKADVRIAFNHDGYWSVYGRQSITAVKPGEQSMNFEPAHWDDPRACFNGTVLHEFGHAIGFMHEHEHPGAACSSEFRWLDDPGYEITFDNNGTFMADRNGRLPGMLSYFATTQGWLPLKTYSQLASIEATQGTVLGPVDVTSIMQYPMDPFLLRTGKASPCYATRNNVLSKGDEDMAQKEYPIK
jgi:tetratricopeptide (TPR) repeat protein